MEPGPAVRAQAAPTAASPWVVRWLDRVPAGSEVLDLACGGGRHTAAALGRGMHVTAVDRDVQLLAALPTQAERIEADLEQGTWPLGERRFDVIIVANYLHRPLFGAIAAGLRPGGVLIYETFAIGNERYGKPSNPNFLLAPGELHAAFASVLHILAFEDGFAAGPRSARLQRIAALRMPLDLAAQAGLFERFAL